MRGHRHRWQVRQRRAVRAPHRYHPAAGQVDQVRHHCARGRAGPGAAAFEHDAADEIALGHDRVVHAVHPGDGGGLRHHAGVDAAFDAGLGAAGDAEQLDAVAEFAGEQDVQGGDGADALDMDRGEIDGAVERQRGQDGQLVGGVDAVDVEGGIGLGVAQPLRLGQHVGELAAVVAHGGQDVVAGAVQDAGDAADAVGGQAFAQGLDDGDAAGDCGLEGQGDAGGLGLRCQGRAVYGEQGLVGGDDGLAGGEGRGDQGGGRAVAAADQFHDDIHGRVGRQSHRVVVPAQPAGRHAAVALAVTGRDGHHRHWPPCPRADQRGVVAQHAQHPGTDRTEAGDPDREGLGHASRFLP